MRRSHAGFGAQVHERKTGDGAAQYGQRPRLRKRRRASAAPTVSAMGAIPRLTNVDTLTPMSCTPTKYSA